MLNIPRNCQLSEQIKQEMTPKRKGNFFMNICISILITDRLFSECRRHL